MYSTSGRALICKIRSLAVRSSKVFRILHCSLYKRSRMRCANSRPITEASFKTSCPSGSSWSMRVLITASTVLGRDRRSSGWVRTASPSFTCSVPSARSASQNSSMKNGFPPVRSWINPARPTAGRSAPVIDLTMVSVG